RNRGARRRLASTRYGPSDEGDCQPPWRRASGRQNSGACDRGSTIAESRIAHIESTLIGARSPENSTCVARRLDYDELSVAGTSAAQRRESAMTGGRDERAKQRATGAAGVRGVRQGRYRRRPADTLR